MGKEWSPSPWEGRADVPPIRRLFPELVGKSALGDLFTRGLPMPGVRELSLPYHQDPVFHAAVREFAESVASVPLQFWDGLEADANPIPESDPIRDLFASPNVHQTWCQFAYAGAVHRKLSGEDFWLLLGPDGRPIDMRMGDKIDPRQITQLWAVPGSCVSMRMDARTGQPESWTYNPHRTGTPVEIPWGGPVVHFRDYDPRQPFRGLGAAEAARIPLQLAWKARQYQYAVLENGGDPGGTYTFDADPPEPEELKRLEQAVKERHATTHAGEPRIAWGKGAKYTPHPFAPKDMEYGDLQRFAREEIASVVGVPLPAIGFLENATYNNIREALTEKWRKVVSYLRSVEDTINAQLLGRMASSGRGGRRAWARFDLSEVESLKRDQFEAARLAKELSVGTGMDINQAAMVAGLEMDPVENSVALAIGGTVPYATIIPSEEDPDAGAAPDQTLNGAQIQQVGEFIMAVSEGRMPKGAAIAALDVALPVPRSRIESIFSSVQEGATKPEPVAVKPPPPPADEPRAANYHTRAVSRRDYYERFLTDVRGPGEDRFRAVARRQLQRYVDAQIARLRDVAGRGAAARNTHPTTMRVKLQSDQLGPNAIETLVLDMDEWIEKFLNAYEEPYRETTLAGVGEAAAELGVDPLDPDNPLVQAIIEESRQFLAAEQWGVLRGQSVDAILSVFHESQTVGTLQELVREALDKLEASVRAGIGNLDARAQAIAVTEAGRASSMGMYAQFQEEGVAELEWVSEGDAQVRPAHAALDGTTVRMGEDFGGITNLKHPHAPGAPASQVVNCRCTFRAVIPE